MSWTYDTFGNRLTQTASGTGSAPQPSFTFSGNNNHADPSGGFAYDFARNITADNFGQSYTYDAEGRIATEGSTTCKYDAEGQLVYENGSHGTQAFLRNSAGHAVSIYNPSGVSTPYSAMYAYIDGEKIGSWQPDVFHFTGQDGLGTKRYESDGYGDTSSGTSPIAQASFTSLPFGDMLSSIGTDPTHFTGKERDLESGNDYFGARYYSSSTGRFMSPDPSGLYYADQTNPQTLNHYSYVLNNPLIATDPDGLDCVYINNESGAYLGFNPGDCDNSTIERANTGHYIDGTVNQISFNSQSQVNGYSASTSDGTFDTPGGSSGLGVATLNPYTNAVSSLGGSVTVNASDPASLLVITPGSQSLLQRVIAAGDNWMALHNRGLQSTACGMSPGNVIETQDAMHTLLQRTGVTPAPTTPDGNTDAGGPQNIFLPNNNRGSNKGFSPMASAGGDAKGNAAAMAAQYLSDFAHCPN